MPVESAEVRRLEAPDAGRPHAAAPVDKLRVQSIVQLFSNQEHSGTPFLPHGSFDTAISSGYPHPSVGHRVISWPIRLGRTLHA